MNDFSASEIDELFDKLETRKETTRTDLEYNEIPESSMVPEVSFDEDVVFDLNEYLEHLIENPATWPDEFDEDID